ncbi:MAG: hypothetical protein ACE5EZ_01420 [Thermodesulfobacteriota bacterium]
MKIAVSNPVVEAVKRHPGVRGAVKAKLGRGLDNAKVANFAERVDLSAKAKKLAHVVKLLKTSPEAREELKELIKEGNEDGRINDRTARIAKQVYTRAVDFYKNHHHTL